jgi:succinate dehydrogenase / fumarate reductase flavoprotein subunit
MMSSPALILPDAKIPSGPLAEKWQSHRASVRLVSPANRRKFTILVVGSGLAGASAAATLGGMGYKVRCFCYQDSPRRAHSIAAQGGINAAKNYRNDGDSIRRLFQDTIKGGDFRAREANVYRLAEISNQIIDHCVAIGVPFAREYGGMLDNRSFGGAQVSRTFYARGQTGQQLLLGAYSQLNQQIATGAVTMHPRTEMLDLVLELGGDGVAHAKGLIARNLVTGALESWAGDAVVLATGGYSNVFYLSTNAIGCNTTAIWRAYKRGAAFANPCFTQIHPTCIPVHGSGQSKLTLMSESLRNDGRVWVPKDAADCGKDPLEIAEADRDYYLERKYPSYGNLAPRDIASRAAKQVCDEGRGVGPAVEGVRRGVYLDFTESERRVGHEAIVDRYGNLFSMYRSITGEDAYRKPMRIYPAPHYTMGGLWVDYNLMSTIPGLFVIGEANFSDHGANRLGASALMQGLADGYFVLPATICDYLTGAGAGAPQTDDPAFRNTRAEVAARIDSLMSAGGKRSPRHFHQVLGELLWDRCGMSRSAAGLRNGLDLIPDLRTEFWRDLKLVGDGESMNAELERAGRVADFLELGELMCRDALARDESCGGHFREEHQTGDGEAVRDDKNFAHVAVWSYRGDDRPPELQIEPLAYEGIAPVTRSYK